MIIEEMNYKEFNAWCNDRACDGRWSMIDALSCIKMIEEVEASTKGKWFNKKAREKAWEDLKAKYK